MASIWIPELNAVFVHIPRCGGTTIVRTLEEARIRFEPAKGAGSHNLPQRYDHPGAFRFTFVRHPLTWYESVYLGFSPSWKFQEQKPQPALFTERTWSPIRLVSRQLLSKSFPEFIRCMLDTEPGFLSRIYEGYVGLPGVPNVQAVGRLESLQADLAAILRRLGWNGSLPTVPPQNVTETDCRPAWNDQYKAQTVRAEMHAIRRFYADDSQSPFFCDEVW